MTGTTVTADWIAVDWGTSRLRAWAMSSGDDVLAEAASDKGMGALEPGAFEGALLELTKFWLRDTGTTPVVACGMVGARQGWIEAPYRTVPCAPPIDHTVTAPSRDPRLSVRIVPGVRQTAPADVMRGEETQITGYLAGNPDFDGVLCLPGTHSKWVRISAGEIVSFQTFMTGELFGLLSKQSVLRHSVQGDGWDDEAFGEALDDAISRPEKLAARLFTVRADSLLHDACAATARARLSGLLIGAELAAARPYWLGQPVAIIGAPRLSRSYHAALAWQGLDATLAAADSMTRAGLVTVHSALKEVI